MPIRHGDIAASRASIWPRYHFCRSTIAPRRSRPTTWNEFLPISMPIVAMVAIDLLDMAVLRLTLAPSQHHSPVGQEHGRTIPLADFAVAQLATRISTRLNGRFSIKEACGCRRLGQRERLAVESRRSTQCDRPTDELRFRREQHLAAALCCFRDRFLDFVETIGGGDRRRDRAGGDQWC